ncbi:MAG: hypothetical protein Q9201_007641 [Fulgogasparrea decipioides]
MRLALQRLLADSDVLQYLRKTLSASEGQVILSTSGPCQDYRRRPRTRRTRCNSSLALSTGYRRVSRDETDDKVNQIRSELRRQKPWPQRVEVLNKQLYRLDSSDREQVIWRLLGEPDFGKDFSIWLELAQIRRRIHGVGGIRLVWRAILERSLNLPTGGELADQLWSHFLELGLEDQEILKEILIYSRDQKESHGHAWRNLYVTVLGRCLRKTPSRAWLCHMRLHKHFPPANQQFRQLLTSVLHDEKLRQIYLKMHNSLPDVHIYDVAIPELCRRGLYATAVVWHKQLTKRGDLPSDARIAEPVLHYLAKIGEETRLMGHSRLPVAAGASMKANRYRPTEVPSPLTGNVFLKSVAEIHGLLPNPGKQFSDQFYARLFATRVFSISNIISALGFLGTQEIGPLALREMAFRELPHNPYHRAIQHRLGQLEEEGILTGKSTFSIVVRRLAMEGKDHLLKNVITCDLHSDTFEDRKLQESLLSFYHEQHDSTAFDRTLAILTANVLEEDKDLFEKMRWNLILRSYLARQQLQSVQGVIEKMRDLRIQVDSESLVRMSQTILSPRQVGRRPACTKELDLPIRIWQDILRSGAPVPPSVWTEILRRLGMSGRLVAFEHLALWLASWYSLPAKQNIQTSMLSYKDYKINPLLPFTVTDLKSSNPSHPSLNIFPRSLQQGIVAWGFQHHHTNSEQRAKYHRNLDWTWGLSLLRRLRDLNVYVPQQVVSKAFKIRLVALFGPGRSRRKINRTNKHRNESSPEQYITQAKKIWGPDLLSRYPTMLVHRGVRRTDIEKHTQGPSNSAESMPSKAKGYGRKGANNLALQLQRLQLSSPKKPGKSNTPVVKRKSATEILIEDCSERQPLASVDSNVQSALKNDCEIENIKQQKRTSPTSRTKKPKKKRKSLVPNNQNEIKSLDLDDKARKHLRKLLDLKDVSSSVQCFESWTNNWTSLCDFVKIAQGTYGAVFRIESKAKRGTFTIGKVIPLQACTGFGSKTKEFTAIEAAANEVSFLATLDEVHGFVEFRKAEILQGEVQESLIAASTAFDKIHQDDISNCWKKACKHSTQLWLFLEMSDAGTDLETAVVNDIPNGSLLQTSFTGERHISAVQVRDIFWQVASALAVAEKTLEFEHRDLHLGNICLSPTEGARIDGGSELWTEHPSVLVTIIDYTISRAKITESKLLFNDLSTDPRLFEGEGELQYDVYRQMRSLFQDQGDKNWENFEPRTNVLWLNHLLIMLMKKGPQKFQRQEDMELWCKLDSMKSDMGSDDGTKGFSSARDVVLYCETGV